MAVLNSIPRFASRVGEIDSYVWQVSAVPGLPVYYLIYSLVCGVEQSLPAAWRSRPRAEKPNQRAGLAPSSSVCAGGSKFSTFSAKLLCLFFAPENPHSQLKVVPPAPAPGTFGNHLLVRP